MIFDYKPVTETGVPKSKLENPKNRKFPYIIPGIWKAEVTFCISESLNSLACLAAS